LNQTPPTCFGTIPPPSFICLDKSNRLNTSPFRDHHLSPPTGKLRQIHPQVHFPTATSLPSSSPAPAFTVFRYTREFGSEYFSPSRLVLFHLFSSSLKSNFSRPFSSEFWLLTDPPHTFCSLITIPSFYLRRYPIFPLCSEDSGFLLMMICTLLLSTAGTGLLLPISMCLPPLCFCRLPASHFN